MNSIGHGVHDLMWNFLNFKTEVVLILFPKVNLKTLFIDFELFFYSLLDGSVCGYDDDEHDCDDDDPHEN